MKTDIGKALLEDFSRSALQEIAGAAKHRAAILRETSNAWRQADAGRFQRVADAIEALEEEGLS